MDWQVDGDVWIERDDDGFSQHLRHIQSPFFIAGMTNPYRLALRYLAAVGHDLGITDDQLTHLAATIPGNPSTNAEGTPREAPGEQLRWWRYRELRNETIVVVIQQTHDVPVRLKVTVPYPIELTTLFLNVYGSALRIVLHRQANGELVVTGATSTLQHNFDFAHATALAESTQPFVLSRPNSAGKGNTKAKKQPAKAQSFITPQLGQLLLTEMLKRAGLDPSAAPAEFSYGIYRYQPDEMRQARADPLSVALPRRRHRTEVLPGSDYAVMIVRHAPFGYDDDFRVGLDSPAVDIVVRFPDATVLAAVPLLAGIRGTAQTSTTAQGLVFTTDPITAKGYDLPRRPRKDHTLWPNRPSSELNAARERVTLYRLDRPSGKPLRQRLRGSNVVVVEPDEVAIGSIRIAPPNKEPGHAFDYDARTNDFAAVNAYYHLDLMMHRLALFGLPFASYAPTFNPKVEVIHRAAIRPGPGGDGRCINAQVRIRPGEQPSPANPVTNPTLHKIEFRFALADMPPKPDADPLGIACDVRWVWHEFGHALIAGATGDLELPFAHSVGDALAAINCDPGSVLAEPDWARWKLRGITFPWVTHPNRRHDRDATQGWSWAGRLGASAGYHQDHGDVAGYHREQVLSSTLFRFYRAIGGDASGRSGTPILDRRRRAADYVTFLIVRALGCLGPASAIPAIDASVFASALMDADRGTLLFDYPGLPPDLVGQRRVGGTVHKVIRWAFEKQGLYARDDQTTHGTGAPEAVDIYVDDGRRGEYHFTDDWTATRQALWLRHRPDAGSRPQTPRRNQDNFLYVRVWNRGYQTARDAKTTVRVAPSSSTLGWPDAGRWTELPVVDQETAMADIGANDHTVFGPFKWRPTRRGNYTILVEVDAIGDRSNINAATGLPCAQPAADSTPLRRLVPYDNNLATAVFTVA
jgi:hypothetical protein